MPRCCRNVIIDDAAAYLSEAAQGDDADASNKLIKKNDKQTISPSPYGIQSFVVRRASSRGRGHYAKDCYFASSGSLPLMAPFWLVSGETILDVALRTHDIETPVKNQACTTRHLIVKA